jgi:hypothetical protein
LDGRSERALVSKANVRWIAARATSPRLPGYDWGAPKLDRAVLDFLKATVIAHIEPFQR